MRAALSAALIALTLRGFTPAFAAHAPSPFDSDHKLPNGGRPLERVDFPQIRDWSTLKISLTRTGCFGTCPSYRVGIDADGTVTWHGTRDVAAVGDRSGTVPVAQVRILYGAFQTAQFFWLLDDYRAPVTDLPIYVVSISYDGRSKTVSDYAGGAIGMPMAVIQLEYLIDATANTGRWIKAAP